MKNKVLKVVGCVLAVIVIALIVINIIPPKQNV